VKRDKVLQVRVTGQELRIISTLARRYHQTRAAFIRYLVAVEAGALGEPMNLPAKDRRR
jgi:hypothetical protein